MVRKEDGGFLRSAMIQGYLAETQEVRESTTQKGVPKLGPELPDGLAFVHVSAADTVSSLFI